MPRWKGVIFRAEIRSVPNLFCSYRRTGPTRYEAVNTMLLNEFLKEHCKVQQLESKAQEEERNARKQEAMIAKQQKQIEVLAAAVEKVNNQLRASKAAPQLVVNN